MLPYCRAGVLLLWIISALFPSVHTYNASDIMTNYPAPFTSNNRVLGLLLSYDLNHVDPLFLITNEYVAMCESGWNVSFVLFTAANWTPKLRKYIRLKTFCYRISDYLDIRYSVHDKTVGTNLASFHRPYIAQEINNFDFFVYHEDDIIFKNSHLSAYLAETKRLYETSPAALENSLIGFQRYRRLTKGGAVDFWSDRDIIETDLIEESPGFVPICIKDQPWIHVDGQLHQGMWALTRGQILHLEERCNFTHFSSSSREHMSSLSLFNGDRPQHCAMTKLLPALHFSSFLIHHYYQQKHVSWMPTYEIDFKIHTNTIAHPPCWEAILKDNIWDLFASLNETSVVIPIKTAQEQERAGK